MDGTPIFNKEHNVKLYIPKGHVLFGGCGSFLAAFECAKDLCLAVCPRIWVMLGGSAGVRKALWIMGRSDVASPWAMLTELMNEGRRAARGPSNSQGPESDFQRLARLEEDSSRPAQQQRHHDTDVGPRSVDVHSTPLHADRASTPWPNDVTDVNGRDHLRQEEKAQARGPRQEESA
jgi:hypothetical protein